MNTFFSLRTVLSFIAEWSNVIVNYANWQHRDYIPWYLYIIPSSSVFLMAVPQTFFIWRCYTLTGKNRFFLATLVTRKSLYRLVELWPSGSLYCVAVLLAILVLSIALAVQYALDPYETGAVSRAHSVAVAFGRYSKKH